MSPSRRAFLQHASAMTAAGLLAQLPARRLWAMTPAQLLPEPDERLLRDLALKAMDAARAAGATFADVRVTAARHVTVACGYSSTGGPASMRPPMLGFPSGYNIRAIVDGAWGFAAGTELTAEAVVRTARTAAVVARGNKPRHRRALELAPAPAVADGVWATPVAQEPLHVPLGEQAELGLAALAEAIKVKAVSSAFTEFHWRRPTVVFATTEGSLIVQRFALALPTGVVGASVGSDMDSFANGEVEGLDAGGYGYEALKGRAIIPGMRAAAERAVALAHAARNATSVDVGRYDLVFAPSAVISLLTSTLAEALDAERALGYHANRAGTSFAAPPADILGKYQAAAPTITVRGDRTRPNGAATVGWDAEEVKPEAYTFVKDGVVVDYHTNRETASHLGAWYRQRGEAVRAHGCVRRCGVSRPAIMLPNLTLEPGAGTTTVDDLIAGTTKGLYIEEGGVHTDQQVINAQAGVQRTRVRQIRNGKLGGYMKDVAFQFLTTPFWKSIDGMGGAGSVATVPTVTDGAASNDPIEPFPMSTIDAVPLRARQVNVLNRGRRA